MLVTESDIFTEVPGINDPGADFTLPRLLDCAHSTRLRYLAEASDAQGENIRYFAIEMAGQIADQIREIKARIEVLRKHYQSKLEEIQNAYPDASLDDMVDLMAVEGRIQTRIDRLHLALDSHA